MYTYIGMRKLLAVTIFALATGFSFPAGAQQNSTQETLLRWHFIGAKALQEQEGLETYQAIAAMPETARLREELLEALSLKAAARFTRQPDPNPAGKQTAALIKPLLSQLLDSESRLVLTSPAAEKADWALAVKTGRDSAQTWSTNLWKLVQSSRLATPASRTIEGQAGWAAKGETYNLGFMQAGEWVLFAGGHSAPQTHEQALAALKKDLGAKSDYTLKADINLAAFSRITKQEKLRHAPGLALTAKTRSDGFRTEINLEYPENLGIKAEKWEVPRELITEPLIAFSAIQGIKERLSRKEEFTKLNPEHTPNQLFVWSQSHTPFSITAAAKVGNTEEFIANLAKQVVDAKNPELKKMSLGELRYHPDNDALVWMGLPIIVPFARPGSEPNEEYVTVGLFPLSEPGTNAAPVALFEQLEKENLVFYAWEITGARIAQWRPLWQMSRFLPGKPIPGSAAASEQWLAAVADQLQNTITEATLEGPLSLKITRQSQLGFNALELVLLAHLADRYEPPATVPSPSAVKPKPAPGKSSPPPLSQPKPAGDDQ